MDFVLFEQIKNYKLINCLINYYLGLLIYYNKNYQTQYIKGFYMMVLQVQSFRNKFL